MARIAENYGQALYRATKDSNEKEAAKAVGRFVDILSKRNELHLAPKVIEAFAAAARKSEGVHEVSFSSAEELTAARKKDIAASFSKALEGEVDIEWKTDESIIAGAVIRYDDVLLDASVKGSLERLKKSLI